MTADWLFPVTFGNIISLIAQMNKENKIYRATIDRSAAFKALGDPTRLRIFEFLCGCCCPVAVEDSGDIRPVDGPTVGEVCCSVTGADQITSTVSRHLRELKIAGLVTIERRGKNMICGVNRDVVAALGDYFVEKAGAAAGSLPGGGCC